MWTHLVKAFCKRFVLSSSNAHTASEYCYELIRQRFINFKLSIIFSQNDYFKVKYNAYIYVIPYVLFYDTKVSLNIIVNIVMFPRV